MESTRFAEIGCVVVFTAVAAVCDLRTKRLPNILTVTALGCALLFHLVAGALEGGWAGMGRHLLLSLGGFCTGFGILLVLWLIGSGGGGDVKFMAALGAWLGAWLTLEVFLVSAMLVAGGSILVLAWEFCRLGMRRSRERYFEQGGRTGDGKKVSETQRRVHRRLMPFGVPAAIATWLVLGWQIQW